MVPISRVFPIGDIQKRTASTRVCAPAAPVTPVKRRIVLDHWKAAQVFFTRADRRLMKFGLILALPVEGAAFWVFSKMSFSPGATELTGFDLWKTEAAFIIHPSTVSSPVAIEQFWQADLRIPDRLRRSSFGYAENEGVS